MQSHCSYYPCDRAIHTIDTKIWLSDADKAHGVIDKNMVSKWEGGLHAPSHFWQGKLCELFGVSPEEFGLVKPPDTEQDVVEPLGIIEQEPQLPAESDGLMPVHLLLDTSPLRVELPDGPTWCGEQITDFSDQTNEQGASRSTLRRAYGLLLGRGIVSVTCSVEITPSVKYK